ncbi:MAG: CHAT domain-containing protein, partial [Planctomycetaceae bacterium]|nr:CHAT domain-containing protein [Planctomycetaceae bacterium]
FGAKELPGMQFSDWLRLPWGGPKLVVLPGYRTAASDALRTRDDGYELFVPLTALLACGAETVVISRWQPGGRTACDQIGEYLKNAKDENLTAAQAWQRASLQIAGSKLVAGEEPRIKGTSAEKAAVDARANHPFFWGSMLFCDRPSESQE